METKKGFFRALFDFSFSEFITTKLIKFFFAFAVIIGIIAIVFIMFRYITYLIPAIIVFFLYVILLRIWLEFIIVVFKIADNTTPRVEK